MSERRRVPRYIAELPAEVAQPVGGAPVKVTMMNLSIWGCSLERAFPLKPKEDCELTFEWEGNRFRGRASVVWKSSQGEAGLIFLDMDAANEQLLRKACANLRLLPLGKIPHDPATPRSRS